MEHYNPEQWEHIKNNYPNLPDNHPQRSPLCAFEEHRNMAVLTFKQICRPPFRLGEIRPIRSETKPYCRWEVDYHLMLGENLSHEILGLKMKFPYVAGGRPTDVEVMTMGASAPTCLTVLYKVKCCSCEKPETLDQLLPRLNLNS